MGQCYFNLLLPKNHLSSGRGSARWPAPRFDSQGLFNFIQMPSPKGWGSVGSVCVGQGSTSERGCQAVFASGCLPCSSLYSRPFISPALPPAETQLPHPSRRWEPPGGSTCCRPQILPTHAGKQEPRGNLADTRNRDRYRPPPSASPLLFVSFILPPGLKEAAEPPGAQSCRARTVGAAGALPRVSGGLLPVCVLRAPYEAPGTLHSSLQRQLSAATFCFTLFYLSSLPIIIIYFISFNLIYCYLSFSF